MTWNTLHVTALDKFIPPFIDLLEKHFDFNQHEFIVFGNVDKYPLQERSNVKLAREGKLNRVAEYARLVVAMHRADKIVLHGLFSMRVVQLLWLMPWLLSKCYWIIWGGDLYVYRSKDRDWSSKKRELFRRPVIKRMGYLVTGAPGDVKNARKWYGATGEHIKCLSYPSNVFARCELTEELGGPTNIQVGNSATRTNNHLDTFRNLEFCRDRNVRVYAPLSYGDPIYAEEVLHAGRTTFGDKFIPLMEFMPQREYLKFLSKMDIAIFNHTRQQACGNIVMLLGLGKKVYIRPESTLFDFFTEHEIKVFDPLSIELAPLSDSDRELNIKRVEEAFSQDALIASLKLWVQ